MNGWSDLHGYTRLLDSASSNALCMAAMMASTSNLKSPKGAVGAGRRRFFTQFSMKRSLSSYRARRDDDDDDDDGKEGESSSVVDLLLDDDEAFSFPNSTVGVPSCDSSFTR